MATPSEKLADSLAQLREIQSAGSRIVRSADISRGHRDRLVRNGFLSPIIRGWYVSTNPDTLDGESTPWYSAFWEFCREYCTDRYSDQWHLAPEASLLVSSGNTVVPKQVIVYAAGASNRLIDLPFGTSIFGVRQAELSLDNVQTTPDGIRILSPANALVRAPKSFFAAHALDAQIALMNIADSSDLLRPLLHGGHSHVAGRLAGALRHLGRADLAEEIVSTMKAADYVVRESNPFSTDLTMKSIPRASPPIVARIQDAWARHRQSVIDSFPAGPSAPVDRQAYLAQLNDSYLHDAYHSLSIEGYVVSDELINRVRQGKWNPDVAAADRQDRNALAARGYWQAFQVVSSDISSVLAGSNATQIVRDSHRDWYRELFQPFVASGIITAGDLAGYRSSSVYLRGSRYVPPSASAVRDAMPALFDLMAAEPDPCVRAVLGHWLVGFIHPYPDGNGRVARFLMNVMLASGGYSWTTIRVEQRREYLEALNALSIDGDAGSFARFLASCMQSRS